MTAVEPSRPHFLTGLSVRLLALTVCFVMLAEVLIYLPSVARYRKVYLEDQIAKANLAAIALEASPDNVLAEPLSMDLLLHAGAHAIVLRSPDRRMLMLSDHMPPTVAATFDLRETGFLEWIGDAVAALARRENRVLRVIGASPRDGEATVEVLLDEAPLRRAMYAFSGRILTLSIIISLITAGFVYLVLQWWMVRPILRLADSMVRFRENPEDERNTIVPSPRSDEIAVAERELASMQKQVRTALRQKTRLALLGSAVGKIHHDLRNTLGHAVLASDRLAGIDDPEVQRVVPRLYQAIDRAVAMTSRTLDFLQDGTPKLVESVFPLNELLSEVEEALRPPDRPTPLLDLDGSAAGLRIAGDRQQLFRVFCNLALNATQAGASTVRIDTRLIDSLVVIDVGDDGPGIPETVRRRLFQPFAGSGRDGGSGLGLVICREIVVAHGGALNLLRTGATGTTFRLELPLSRLAEPGS